MPEQGRSQEKDLREGAPGCLRSHVAGLDGDSAASYFDVVEGVAEYCPVADYVVISHWIIVPP